MKRVEIPLALDGYTLRPFRTSDAPALQRLADDTDVSRFLRNRFPHPYTLEDAREWIERTQSESGSPPLVFAIAGANASLLGSIGLERQADVYRHSAELGYWLGRRHWGRGVATAAVEAICSYGFETLGLRRIYACVFAPNVASARVLEKAGFALEGRRRNAVRKDGVALDELLYGLLPDELAEGNAE
ncbi:MAG TPA: GNAT family N-acetyltransferase [Thermoanaerobaculia bacterium]|nr:GNAT family N-acetyltransferase [Thermoanaerobaculia bacterium]